MFGSFAVIACLGLSGVIPYMVYKLWRGEDSSQTDPETPDNTPTNGTLATVIDPKIIVK